MAVEGGFNRGGNDMSRRSLLERLSVSSVLPAVVAVAATSSPEAAVAKGGPASEAELKRMKVGYDGLNYLLDKENFEKITTKCNPECNRNPDAIREYVGRRPSLATNFQRSTSHALRSKQRGSPQPPSLASLPLVDASTAPPDRTNLMITPQVLGAAFDGAPSLQGMPRFTNAYHSSMPRTPPPATQSPRIAAPHRANVYQINLPYTNTSTNTITHYHPPPSPPLLPPPRVQIEKVMEKAQDNIEDVDLLEDYIAAIENWQNAVSNSNR